MESDIQRVLIPRHRILERVGELADRITADHTPPRLHDAEITLVAVMTGAMIFCADLIRRIPVVMKIGLLSVSSYPGESLESRGAQLLSQRLGDLRGRHVLLVDDILDSGRTLGLVTPRLIEAGAAGVKTCVLLRKDRESARQTPVDYVGFDIPDEFVVGYGMDFDDYYRNLPDIVTLKPQVIRRGS